MVDALRPSPPKGVAKESWSMMLGDGEPSFERYCRAVEEVCGSLRFRSSSNPSNTWSMSADERKAWEDTKRSSIFDKAKT